MILKLIYLAFPTQFNKLAFNSQTKPINFDKLSFQFIDSNGKKYYRYMDDFEMPIVRKGYIEKCFKELEYCLNADEMTDILTAMKLAINKRDNRGNMTPDIAMIGHLITEIENRKKTLLHPEILFDITATMLIREDENPSELDIELHGSKIEQFKKDSQTGLRDFFYTAGLTTYLPFLEQFGGDLNLMIAHSKAKIEGLQKQVRNYISAGQ